MVSVMAIEDCERLEAEGVKLSPRDVVRLNALGLRVERGSHAADFHAIPRVAFVGDLALTEPTIAGEAWMCVAEKTFDGSDSDTVTLLRALEMSTPAERLPSPTDARAVEDAIAKLKAGKLAGVTVRQLRTAIEYALNGADQRTGEYPPPTGSDDGSEPDAGDLVEGGWICEGVVMRIGSITEIMRMTSSQLSALCLYRREMEFGEGCRKSEHARALGGYLAAVEEIKSRLSNGNGKR